jgi:hypothetical protein
MNLIERDRMSNERVWYREPETFIAFAALIVSLTAVVVGVYEASLQRKHDVAEVWPHLELSTWLDKDAATLRLENTGLGPGIVQYVEVRVDGKPQADWDSALDALYGHAPPPHSSATVVQHALRPGDRAVLVGVPTSALPQPLWPTVSRIMVRVCYASVFESYWMVTDTLGKSSRWDEVRRCPSQPAYTDL